MGKPKWQRARLLIVHGDPGIQGLEIWVRAEAPKVEAVFSLHIGEMRPAEPRYRTNFRVPSDYCYDTVPAVGVELLARSPDDFANDVPLVDYEDWKRDALTRKLAHA